MNILGLNKEWLDAHKAEETLSEKSMNTTQQTSSRDGHRSF